MIILHLRVLTCSDATLGLYIKLISPEITTRIETKYEQIIWRMYTQLRSQFYLFHIIGRILKTSTVQCAFRALICLMKDYSMLWQNNIHIWKSRTNSLKVRVFTIGKYVQCQVHWWISGVKVLSFDFIFVYWVENACHVIMCISISILCLIGLM